MVPFAKGEWSVLGSDRLKGPVPASPWWPVSTSMAGFESAVAQFQVAIIASLVIEVITHSSTAVVVAIRN